MKIIFVAVLSIVLMGCQTQTPKEEVLVGSHETTNEIENLEPILEQLPEFEWKHPLVLPELLYAYDAMNPFADARTMEIHHSKHHNGYTIKANKALEQANLNDTPLILAFADINKYSDALRNNGGGYYNHCIFWTSITPSGSAFKGELADAIISKYKSLEHFQEVFNTAAASQFGSGWAWLVVTFEGELAITNSANQNNPLMDGEKTMGIPLFNLDVWEHAYYLSFQNKRNDYIANFWKVVDWEGVTKRYLLIKDILSTNEK